MFPFFLIAPIISRNVGTKGHLRKEIILLKYQFFRFMTKSGGQWLLQLKLKLELKLEDYDIVHFTIHKDGFKIE